MTGLLGEVDLPAPIGDRWWQDYLPGSVVEFGYVSLSEAEIVAFAQAYDRQQIHTDPVWSATGPFHGVIASGVQTIAVCMGLYVDHYISRVASLASPGLDEIRWPAPVRPGDRLHIRSPSPRRVSHAPSPTGDWCTPRWRPSTRTTMLCCRSPR